LLFQAGFAGVLALAYLTALAAADNPPGGDDWKYDVVYPKKGEPYRGLVLDQKAGRLSMQWVVRRPGRPTIIYPITLSGDEIARVEMLSEEEHESLRLRLKALREEHKRLDAHLKDPGASEKGTEDQADKLDLREKPWVGDARVTALAYESSYFHLVSNAPRGIVEAAAIRLEQAYTAYAHFLPPRVRGKATTIVLPQSLADYQALMRGQGRNLLNPAFFDPDRNQIVCAFDWRRMTEELEKVVRYHAKQMADLQERETELRKAYRGAIPAELKTALAKQRNDIQAAEKRNAQTFERAKQRLFQRLFHEAFHAYLLNFVYPPGDGEVPRWLNEGLAQIFETAIFEVGELRIGHADEERLHAVRRALSKNALLPLSDLLRSRPKQFLIAHDGDKQVSDRHYLASWALAFYLTFECKLLGTPALDHYVRERKRGVDPLDAFTKLTGKPLMQFEREYLDYLRHLRPDGSVGKAG
jgi:hypothetical protein